MSVFVFVTCSFTGGLVRGSFVMTDDEKVSMLKFRRDKTRVGFIFNDSIVSYIDWCENYRE